MFIIYVNQKLNEKTGIHIFTKITENTDHWK